MLNYIAIRKPGMEFELSTLEAEKRSLFAFTQFSFFLWLFLSLTQGKILYC